MSKTERLDNFLMWDENFTQEEREYIMGNVQELNYIAQEVEEAETGISVKKPFKVTWTGGQRGRTVMEGNIRMARKHFEEAFPKRKIKTIEAVD